MIILVYKIIEIDIDSWITIKQNEYVQREFSLILIEFQLIISFRDQMSKLMLILMLDVEKINNFIFLWKFTSHVVKRERGVTWGPVGLLFGGVFSRNRAWY